MSRTLPLAGFQVIIIGRFWVFTEGRIEEKFFMTSQAKCATHFSTGFGTLPTHQSFPSAMTCCFFSSLKTMPMPREPIDALLGVNGPGIIVGWFSDDLHWPVLGDR